jgi:transcriptional regulator
MTNGDSVSKPTALLQGTLYLLILKILELEPRTGWSISQRLRQMSNETLQVSHGSLYPALHKLEHEGWIRGEWRESHTGRPARFYALTRAGRRQLRLEAANWTRLSVAVNGILESV